MNYVTTNIRLSEEDYLRLKLEAASRRKSLSAVIREKLGEVGKVSTKTDIDSFLADLNKTANLLGKKVKGFNSVKALREMRYEDK